MNLSHRIDTLVDGYPFGSASAMKRDGKYVPVIDRDTQPEPLCGLTYTTRGEAECIAFRVLEHRRETMRRMLLHPTYGALREQWGLPRDLPAEAGVA